MKKITVGLDQVGKDTPASIKLIYRSTMFISAIWTFFTMSKFCGFSDHVNSLTVGFLGLSNFAIYSFCQCFGFKQPESTQPIDFGQTQPINPEHTNPDILKN